VYLNRSEIVLTFAFQLFQALLNIFSIDSKQLLCPENLEQRVFMTWLSRSYLFFVSILHSSQKTRESELLGSECWEKHFLQMECPQTSVRGLGSFRYSRQERQDKVYSIGANVSFILS